MNTPPLKDITPSTGVSIVLVVMIIGSVAAGMFKAGQVLSEFEGLKGQVSEIKDTVRQIQRQLPLPHVP